MIHAAIWLISFFFVAWVVIAALTAIVAAIPVHVEQEPTAGMHDYDEEGYLIPYGISLKDWPDIKKNLNS